MLELAARTNLSNMLAMDSTGLLFLAVTEEEGEEECSLLLRIQLGNRLVVLERPLYPVPHRHLRARPESGQGQARAEGTFSPPFNRSGGGAIQRSVVI